MDVSYHDILKLQFIEKDIEFNKTDNVYIYSKKKLSYHIKYTAHDDNTFTYNIISKNYHSSHLKRCLDKSFSSTKLSTDQFLDFFSILIELLNKPYKY